MDFGNHFVRANHYFGVFVKLHYLCVALGLSSVIPACVFCDYQGMWWYNCMIWFPDIDECKTNAHNCTHDALCQNTEGGYFCACLPGFVGHCEDCEGEQVELIFHCDVIKWKHYLRYCPFVRGIHRLSVDSSHKGTVTRTFDVSLLLDWRNTR